MHHLKQSTFTDRWGQFKNIDLGRFWKEHQKQMDEHNNILRSFGQQHQPVPEKKVNDYFESKLNPDL